MASRKLEVQILGDASSLERAFGKAGKASSGFGSSIGKVGKVAAYAAGGAALGGLALTLRAGISEYKENVKVAAQTEAVLKSTGKAAGVTADEVFNLGGEIQNYSGISDEVIRSGQNLLLTFTNIRNEAGKGNDIFTQATKIATDMSVALGQDMKSSAIQLGKALNDPVRGVTALQRVGVSFTAGQRKQIETMVKAGRTLDAQKLILGELNKEFAGSAKAVGDTLPGQVNKLKQSFGDLSGELVAKAVPALTTFTGFLAEKGLPALETAFDTVGSVVGPAISKLGEAFKNAAPAITGLMSGFLESVQSAGPAIVGILQPLGEFVLRTLVPVFRQLQDIGSRAIAAVAAVIARNGPAIRQIFENVGKVIQNLAKVIVPLLDVAFTKVLPFAVRVLIPALVLATGVIAKLSSAVAAVANFVRTRLAPAFVSGWQAASRAVAAAWSVAGPIIQGIAKTVGAVIGTVKALISGDWSAAWSSAKKAVTGAVTGLKTVLLGIPSFVFGLAVRIGEKIIAGILDGLGGLVSAVKDKIESGLRSAVDKLTPWSPVEHGGRIIGAELARGVPLGWIDGTKSLPTTMEDTLRTAVERARSTVEGMQSRVADAFGRLADKALQAYDSKTEAMLAKVEGRLEAHLGRIEKARQKATKSELALARMAAEDRQRALDEGLASADAALAQAQGMDAADPARAQAILDAEQQRADALRDIRRAELEERAAMERAAADKRAAAQAERATNEANRTKLELSSDRALRRQHLEDYLSAVREKLGQVPGIWRNTNSIVRKVLERFADSLKDSGARMGEGFAQGLRESTKAVEQAAKELGEAVERYAKLKSPAEKGPLASLDTWWEPFGKTLVSGLDLSAVSVGLDRELGTIATPAMSVAPMAVAGGGPVVNVYVDGSVIAERDLATTVRDVVIQEGRRVGPNLFGGYA